MQILYEYLKREWLVDIVGDGIQNRFQVLGRDRLRKI